MAKLRTAMDAAFWDLNISTSLCLDGRARSIPGEPIPLDGSKSGASLRIQELEVLREGFPLGLIPTWSPTSHKELGSFAFQSLFFKYCSENWWLGSIGQLRPKKLISSLKADLSKPRNMPQHFLDKSLYSIGLWSQVALPCSTSLLVSTERYGEGKESKYKAMLYTQLDDHDISLEAAGPELFIDSKGKYWEVPTSISCDFLSAVTEAPLRYRFGLHKNIGLPKAVNSPADKPPLALLPGLCAKAAISYQKSREFWREEETEEDLIIEKSGKRYENPAYDVRMKEPHATLSGIIGTSGEYWFGNKESTPSAASSEVGDDSNNLNAKSSSTVIYDVFGSGCFTFQHGKFRKFYKDLTRIDARLDFPSASGLLKQFSNTSNGDTNPEDTRSSPRFNLILQQQVAGPIVLRLDSRFLLGGHLPHLEDAIFSFNCYFKILQSGKMMAWYSPKRKEGMIELRVFDF